LEQDKAITLGHPSYLWRFGQERRLNLVREYVSLEDQAILDVGCGLGMYMRAFRRFSPFVYGVDVDGEKLVQASQDLPNLGQAVAERLPYADGTFDAVLSHEVIEHVTDDRQALADAVRVLRAPDPGEGRPGGRLVIFAPNRLYPFETHGAYLAGRYREGNVPLVNYLPDRWRSQVCPHVRVYTRRDLRELLEGLPVKVVTHIQIFPGYDKVVRRRPGLGRWLRRVTYFLEHTPLRLLGLSHFMVVEKIA
jgi:SAM-dependent methyltransferase